MYPRGQLHIFLGAAQGVGKTYAMLEEGRALRAQGRDVVAGIVQTHGRAATKELCAGIEMIPTTNVLHNGILVPELNLPAILARRPQVVLVDELAHTNVPGAKNEKRWQDVAELLNAGIDVISAVNVEQIESLHDVATKITGLTPTETIPDEVLRAPAQIKVVDLDPKELSKRLASGLIFPPERIDAAISSYFRLGNLIALRELALLWLAGEVDQDLIDYRDAHNIAEAWPARERVVVAITGGAGSETLLRRGARIASRAAGGKLFVVHVSTEDGLRAPRSTNLPWLRTLTEQLGGTYHQVVGADITNELIGFAKSVNATQLVIGSSRRKTIKNALFGSALSSNVVRRAGDIDVHLVGLDEGTSPLNLPPKRGSLSARRRAAGFILAIIGFPALTGLLYLTRSPGSVTVDVLTYQLFVVVVALAGGLWPALLTAFLSGLTLDFLFVEPYETTTVSDGYHLLEFLIYIAVAVLVSLIVDRAARKTRIARRAASESELLQTIAGSVLRGEGAIQALLDRCREAFSLERLELLCGTKVLASSGEIGADDELTRIDLDAGHYLEFYGGDLTRTDQRLLAIITAQLNNILEHQQLQETAQELKPIAASDKLRGALLSALSHDLRRPLASATAAITGLQTAGSALSEQDKAELIDTADESLQALATLVRDLLDVSRINTGVIKPLSIVTDPGGIVIAALDELGATPSEVEILIDTDAQLIADPALLQRVVVNLLDNALRFTPPNIPVRIAVNKFHDTLEIRVIDRGPGVGKERQESIFNAFQRAGDTDNTTGLGLGLALSKGFTEAMAGKLSAETTPGGGLTMVLTLPAAMYKQEQE